MIEWWHISTAIMVTMTIWIGFFVGLIYWNGKE